MKRGAGVLCHISSLPGKYGIGSLGDAFDFASRLARIGVTYWQILPLVQTGYGDSPYQSVSCHSGNPYFIDLERLAQKGLLSGSELKTLRMSYGRGEIVDYGVLYGERYATLRLAFSRFCLDDDTFCRFVRKGTYDDYALFMTAKSVYGGSFCSWAEPLKRREAASLETLRTEYRGEYLFWQFVQYVFWEQWRELKQYCNGLGILLVGDIPLYVAYDSADVWAHPELFKLDDKLKPLKVAGVPPDYFSATGQLWGNPVYDWDAHRESGYDWWRARLEGALETYDLVRIDHFRGIDRYYEIPANAPTAAEGAWADGPKDELFEGLGAKRQRIIAEDLGVSDEGVRALLRRTGFPGMKVLLFAFDGNPENPFLPHKIEENSVCYTGTHDNNTVVGYIEAFPEEELSLFRLRVAAELKRISARVPLKSGKDFTRAFVRLALASEANIAIIPIQDVLGCAKRMNLPGSQEGNWQFRLAKAPSAEELKGFENLIKKYRR